MAGLRHVVAGKFGELSVQSGLRQEKVVGCLCDPVCCVRCLVLPGATARPKPRRTQQPGTRAVDTKNAHRSAFAVDRALRVCSWFVLL